MSNAISLIKQADNFWENLEDRGETSHQLRYEYLMRKAEAFSAIAQAEAAIRQAEALERIADNWERMWQFKLDQHSHD